jgi:hypothetical protein
MASRPRDPHLSEYFLSPDAFHRYLTFCFLWAFAWGTIALLLRHQYRHVSLCSTVAGVVLGFNNYGAIFFLIVALAQPNWESSVVFPVVSVSVVLLSFFGGPHLLDTSAGRCHLACMLDLLPLSIS